MRREVDGINALICIFTRLSCYSINTASIIVFPLIEKLCCFCYGVTMQLFPRQKTKSKEPARRKLTKEDILIAQRIKQLRKERKLTQEELSDILGMNALYITMVEAKQQGVSLPMIYRIAKVFNLSLKEFFSF